MKGYLSPLLEGLNVALPWEKFGPVETPACATCPASAWMLRGQKLTGLKNYCAMLGEITWDSNYLPKHDGSAPVNTIQARVDERLNPKKYVVRFCDGRTRALDAMGIEEED